MYCPLLSEQKCKNGFPLPDTLPVQPLSVSASYQLLSFLRAGAENVKNKMTWLFQKKEEVWNFKRLASTLFTWVFSWISLFELPFLGISFGFLYFGNKVTILGREIPWYFHCRQGCSFHLMQLNLPLTKSLPNPRHAPRRGQDED